MLGSGFRRRFPCAIALCLTLALPLAAQAAPGSTYNTLFRRWRAADGELGTWQRSGVFLAADGTLRLDPATAVAGTDPYAPGGYYGHDFYNGGTFLVGEAVSPVLTSSFNVAEGIASWNADTPPGSWVEVQIRAQFGTRWSKWYNLGIWAADSSTIERHSVSSQGDTDGYVAVDTLVVTNKKTPASAVQLKARLFRATGSSAIPTLRNVAVTLSTPPVEPSSLAAGNPSLWNRVIPVSPCSQMVYPDGGEVWCSPTSTSMVLGYWQSDTGACEPRVRAAVTGVYDWRYNGHGNWPFNTAYAATRGLEAYVVRFTSMAQLEPWIAAGVPVIISYAWGNGELTGAPIPSSNGHLAVIVGFDAAGNPVMNDPAAPSDSTVRRTYYRSELEPLWLMHSGGTAYILYPPGWAIPAQ